MVRKVKKLGQNGLKKNLKITSNDNTLQLLIPLKVSKDQKSYFHFADTCQITSHENKSWIIDYQQFGERVVIHGHSPKRFLLLQIPGVLQKLSQGDDPRFRP